MDASKIIKAAARSETPSADPKLIKKEAYSAVLDAVTILDTAREQARAIIRDAEARSAQVFEEARRKGEEEGLARYLDAIGSSAQALDNFYTGAEPELVRLAAGVARKIVGEELQISADTILKIAREALAVRRQARQITIKVHSSAAVHLRKNVSALGLSNSCEVQVIASDSVTPGGCIIESEFGVIDAQLDTQLRLIERGLLRIGSAQ